VRLTSVLRACLLYNITRHHTISCITTTPCVPHHLPPHLHFPTFACHGLPPLLRTPFTPRTHHAPRTTTALPHTALHTTDHFPYRTCSTDVAHHTHIYTARLRTTPPAHAACIANAMPRLARTAHTPTTPVRAALLHTHLPPLPAAATCHHIYALLPFSPLCLHLSPLFLQRHARHITHLPVVAYSGGWVFLPRLLPTFLPLSAPLLFVLRLVHAWRPRTFPVPA